MILWYCISLVPLLAMLTLLVIVAWKSMAQKRRLREPGPPKCPACDYELYGLAERRCPECGRVFRLDELNLTQTKVSQSGVLEPHDQDST